MGGALAKGEGPGGGPNGQVAPAAERESLRPTSRPVVVWGQISCITPPTGVSCGQLPIHGRTLRSCSFRSQQSTAQLVGSTQPYTVLTCTKWQYTLQSSCYKHASKQTYSVKGNADASWYIRRHQLCSTAYMTASVRLAVLACACNTTQHAKRVCMHMFHHAGSTWLQQRKPRLQGLKLLWPQHVFVILHGRNDVA